MALPKIDVPTYETTLTSTGKTIRFRPFLVKEQKLFLMAAQSEDVKEVVSTIKQIITNCVIGEFDVDSLPTFDLEHVFLQLRARSVGEIVNLKYTCNNSVKDESGEEKKCGNVVDLEFNILDIKPQKEKNHTNKIQLTEKLGIVMKYPNFGMLDKIDTKASDVNQLLDIITSCIDFIYDSDQIYYAKDTTKQELVEFLENLNQADLEKIQNFFDTLPKLKKNVHFKCKKCGYEEDMNIEGIQSFFG